MKSYADFEIWINSGSTKETGERVYPTQVIASPSGPASGALTLPLADEAFTALLEKVSGEGASVEARKEFGRLLFNALFSDAIKVAWLVSKGRVDAGEGGLHLRLCLNAPELSALPWELLFDDDFLAINASFGVSRYLPVPEPPAYSIEQPLRILVTTHSPQGLPPIDPQEVEKLEAALQALGQSVHFHILANAPMAEVQSELQKEYHVLHFLGHGTASKLAVTADDRQSKLIIGDAEFANLFAGRKSLRLVVLNACHSAQAGNQQLFSGIGPALVQKRIPAVVAMQYLTVQLDTASQFSRRLYGSLANGLPVDVAVNQARQFLAAGALLGGRDWSTPVLYLGTRDGRILNLLDNTTDETERAWHSLQKATQNDAAATAAMVELTARFVELADANQSVALLLAIQERLRQARKEFAACLLLIDAPGLTFNNFKTVWDDFLSGVYTRLQTAAGKVNTLSQKPDFQALDSLIPEIETTIVNMGANLRAQVLGFATRLQKAETVTQEEVDERIRESIALSSKTLGRFAPGGV